MTELFLSKNWKCLPNRHRVVGKLFACGVKKCVLGPFVSEEILYSSYNDYS